MFLMSVLMSVQIGKPLPIFTSQRLFPSNFIQPNFFYPLYQFLIDWAVTGQECTKNSPSDQNQQSTSHILELWRKAIVFLLWGHFSNHHVRVWPSEPVKFRTGNNSLKLCQRVRTGRSSANQKNGWSILGFSKAHVQILLFKKLIHQYVCSIYYFKCPQSLIHTVYFIHLPTNHFDRTNHFKIICRLKHGSKFSFSLSLVM